MRRLCWHVTVTSCDDQGTGDQSLTTSIPEPWELGDVLSEVSDLLEVGGVSVAIKRLSPLRPADMAAIVAELSEGHLRQLMARMEDDAIAEVLDYLDVDRGSRVFASIPEGRRPAVLDETHPEVATDLLHRIAWDDAAHTLVRMRNLNVVGDLLIHDDDDAGGLMSPTFAKLREYWTVRHALRVLKQLHLEPENLRELFAVDSQDTLVGRMELSDLVFAPPGATISEVMNRDVISVSATEDQESAVRLMERYRLPSIPVTNGHRQLQGVITANSLVEVAEQEATEDMLRLFGVSGNIAAESHLRLAIINRLPWLVLNLFTVILAGFVLSLFQPTLNAMVLLAAFLPVVMGQAGIAGTQTVTIIVRSMALGERSTSNVWHLLLFELALSLAQGLAVGGILGIIVHLWQNDWALTLLVTCSLVLNLILAALAGVMVPMFMRLVRIDPAMASAVIVTTATDICGIVMYLGLASIFLTLLVS